MRVPYVLVLLVAAVAAQEFELALPPDLVGWDAEPPDPKYPATKAVLKAERAEIRLTAGPGEMAQWLRRAEEFLHVKEKTSSEGTFGGEKCLVLDLRGEKLSRSFRATSRFFQRGETIWELAVYRWTGADADEEVDEEIESILKSFRFKGPAPTPPEEAPESPPEPRREVKNGFWKVKLVKPEGLGTVPPKELDETEKLAGVIAKFDGRRDGAMLLVRVYARTRNSRRYRPIEEIEKARIEQFRKEAAVRRAEPEAGAAWKPPLAKETRTLRLTRMRRVKETSLWYFMESRNGRQYQIQLFLSADGEKVWKKEIAEILDSFTPLR